MARREHSSAESAVVTRMLNGEPFTAAQLILAAEQVTNAFGSAEKIALKYQRNFSRCGLISYVRSKKQVVWSLTDHGRNYARDFHTGADNPSASRAPVSITPVRIGYLRNAPSSLLPPREVRGPLKAMLNKLALSGLVEVNGSRYRRTSHGDSVLHAFDQSLTKAEIATLEAFRRDNRAPRPPRHQLAGATKLQNAGLLHLSSRLSAYTTTAGEDVLRFHAAKS